MSIGSELLHGVITDRNAVFLTQELTNVGIEVFEVVQIGDSLERLTATISRLSTLVEIIVTTGGIGPTGDDMTREAIAAFCGEYPQVDAGQVQQIEKLFASRGQEMPEQNKKQAWLIPSSVPIPNSNGSAPGWYVRHSGTVIIALPGPPRENQLMWQDTILPYFLPDLINQSIRTKTLKTIGIGESAAEREIKDVVRRPFPITATYAKSDGVHIRVTAVHQNTGEAERAVTATVDEISSILKPYIYGEDYDSLAYSILRPLQSKQHKLSIWEIGSSGALAQLLQGDPHVASTVDDVRSSTFDLASTIAGTKIPAELAIFCAKRAAENSNVSVAASLTVLLKQTPDELEQRGEIGIALVHPKGTTSRTQTIIANSDEIRRRAALWSAEFLWNEILTMTGARQD